MNEARINAVVRGIVVSLLVNGLSFEEGLIASRAIVFLMEEIKRNGNIDEDFLANAAEKYVREEIARL